MERLFRSTSCALGLFILSGCIPRISYRSEIIHKTPGFDGSYFSDHTLAIVPTIFCHPAMNANAISTGNFLASQIRYRYPETKIVGDSIFLQSILSSIGVEALNRFFGLFCADSILTLQIWDSLWQNIGTDAILITCIREGAKIRTSSGIVKRTLRLEVELWAVNQPEALWRVRTDAWSLNSTTTDAQLILESLAETLKLFPPWKPGTYRERTW